MRAFLKEAKIRILVSYDLVVWFIQDAIVFVCYSIAKLLTGRG